MGAFEDTHELVLGHRGADGGHHILLGRATPIGGLLGNHTGARDLLRGSLIAALVVATLSLPVGDHGNLGPLDCLLHRGRGRLDWTALARGG